jgi:hypothetical protein
MMGHPYSYGWRACLKAERRKQRVRLALTAAAVSVLMFFPVVAVLSWLR